MTDVALRLKEEALRLSEEDRIELLNALRESLPDEIDEDYDEAWKAELNRRSEEIDFDKVVGRPSSEVFEELRKRYT